MYKIAHFLATGGGVGLIPIAPGTWGSLLGLGLGFVVIEALGYWGLAAGIFLLLGLGTWASGRYARALGASDPGEVVVDEIVGQWIALLWLPQSLGGYIVAFLMFRLFDIAKPWPVSHFNESYNGGWGIMMDDVAAGVMALFSCMFFSLVF